MRGKKKPLINPNMQLIEAAVTDFIDELIISLSANSAGAYAAGAFHANGYIKAGVGFEVLQKDALEFAKAYKKRLVETGIIDVTVPVVDNAGKVVRFESQKYNWLGGKSTTMRNNISDLITNGLKEGKSTEAIAKDLHGYCDMQREEAKTIARSETARCYCSGEKERYTRAGVEYVQFMGGPDACEICDPLIGKVFKLGAEPDLPIHPNCRCDYRPYFPEVGEIV